MDCIVCVCACEHDIQDVGRTGICEKKKKMDTDVTIHSWSGAWSKFHLYSHVLFCFFFPSGSTCGRALPEQWHFGCASPGSLSSALSVKGEMWHLWPSSLRASQAKLNYIHRWWSTESIKNGLADLGRCEFELEWLDHVGGILQLVRAAPMWFSSTPRWCGSEGMRWNNILECNSVFSNSFLWQSHQQLNAMCLTKALFTIMNCTVALYVSTNHRYLHLIHFFKASCIQITNSLLFQYVERMVYATQL